MLDALGLPVPSDATGGLISSVGGETGPGVWAGFVEDNERAVFRDRVTGPTAVTFIVTQVVVYALAAAALLTRRRRLRQGVGVAALGVLAVPSLAFLSGLVPYRQLGVAGYVVALLAAAMTAGAVAHLLGRLVARRNTGAGALVAPLVLVAVVWAVLVVDVATGATLQIDTVLGYSPTVAGRFAGFGNLAFALLAMSTLVVATGWWGVSRLLGAVTGPTGRAVALLVVGTSFALTVVADGHPALGSDVGGVLATVPGFAVVVLLLGGVALNWRRSAVIAVATLGVLAGFAVLDLARPASSRTHLGRLVARTADGGLETLATVLERKLTANVNILTTSVWALVIPVALVFLAFITWRRAGLLGRCRTGCPGCGPAWWGPSSWACSASP